MLFALDIDHRLHLSTAKFADVSMSDRSVIRSLHESTHGPNWMNSSGWLTNPFLGDWYGVTSEGGLVTKLSLDSNGLEGT